jgi:DNA-binding NarL/FixJ family response regulator
MSVRPGSTPATESRVIRVLVIDDHPLLRDGIAALVGGQPDMEIAGQAGTGREGIEQFRILRPDVTLMDLQMPDKNGIEAIVGIRQVDPEARVIVLTTYSGDVQVVRAMEAGARAYLLKNSLHKELLDTIRTVHLGNKTVSPAIAAEMAEYSGKDALTLKEIDVLRLIARGYANKVIAAELFITEETVKSRVKNILSKLHANDRTHAVTIALSRGIISL